MDEEIIIKIDEESKVYELNKKSARERNLNTNKNIGISGSNIQLNFISEEKINTKIFDPEGTLFNNINENQTITHNDNNTEVYFNNIKKRREDEEEKEKQLIFLYTKYYTSFNNKKYETILNEVDNLKKLFYKNSNTSFKINILKIRCLLKALKAQYVKLITFKTENTNYNELTKNATKIMKEFENISYYIYPKNTSIYEEITQVYAKFLLYLALISKLKEEYIKSMSYVTMGVNLMKIFFMRRKVAINIKTYTIYSQLLLLLINYLIGDNNFESAIFYCQILFKVLKAIYKIIVKKKLDKKYYIKFLEYTGYNFVYAGVCLEQIENINNDEAGFLSYKQAYYFLNKVDSIKPKTKNFFLLLSKDSKDNAILFLSQLLVEKYKKLFEKEKIKYTILRYKPQDDSGKKEKILDIDYIENLRNQKYKPLEDKLYKNILTPHTQTHIEKMDNELISVVYQQKDEQRMEPTTISPKSKKFLYNFELYNILMSNRFRNYIIKNNKLQFNNPFKEKQSIESLQRFLNKNIKITDNSEVLSDMSSRNNNNKLIDNSSEKKSINLKLIEKPNLKKTSKIILNKNIFTKLSLTNKSLSSHNLFSPKNNLENLYKNENINPIMSYNQRASKQKKIIFERNLSNSLLIPKKFHSEMNPSKTLYIEKKLNFDYFKIKKKIKKDRYADINNNYRKIKNVNIRNTERTQKWRNTPNFKNSTSYSILENDFERRYLDKNILSPKYFKKVSYLDSLVSKELTFQKTMLKLKGNSSKMFLGTYEKELIIKDSNDKKLEKENAYNSYLILIDKANDEIKKLKLEDYNDKYEQPNIFGYPHNVLKVFKKYLQTSRDNAERRLRIYSESSKNVKKNNETRLLILNKGLKELNYIMSYKNKQLKSFPFRKRIKIIK